MDLCHATGSDSTDALDPDSNSSSESDSGPTSIARGGREWVRISFGGILEDDVVDARWCFVEVEDDISGETKVYVSR